MFEEYIVSSWGTEAQRGKWHEEQKKHSNLMIPPLHPVCFVSRNCWMHGAQFYSAIFSQSLACFSDFPVPATTPMHLHGLLEDCVEEMLRSFCLGGHMLPHTWAVGESLSGAVVPGLMSSAGQPLEVSSHIHSYNELTQKKSVGKSILLTTMHLQIPQVCQSTSEC